MLGPWTRGAALTTRPHALSTPGVPAPCSRSSRASLEIVSVLLLSSILGCAGASPEHVADPGTLALTWLTQRQKPDGSFPTDEYLPREIGTPLVMGLLASLKPDRAGLDPVLAGSVKYVESLQSPDGAFRYATCPDVAINTSLTLLALFACRDRATGGCRPEDKYVEVVDPRLLHRFLVLAEKDPMNWDQFLERKDLPALAPPPSRVEPEDLYRDACKAVATKDTEAASRIRMLVLAGQNPDGSWDSDGPGEGRRIIAAAYRIRTLELLCVIASDAFVRR